MMSLKISRAELVEKFGSEECKQHFAKYNKFKNKNIEAALIKNVECHYEKVEIVKEGRFCFYVLINEKAEATDKIDKRIANGAYSVPYTRNLDIIVVSALEQGDINENAQTLNNWCLDFGLINPELHDLVVSKHSKQLREKHIEDLIKTKIITYGQERIVNDFIRYTQYLQSQLAGTLNRMRRAGIIEYYLVPMGYIEEEAKSVKLHEGTLKKILNLQRRLMEKYDVDQWYLDTYENSKKSKEYKAEWKEELSKVTDENEHVIGLSYWYKTYAIMLKARKNRIITYLETYNKELIQQYKENEKSFRDINMVGFVKGRGEYVEQAAKKHEVKFLEPRVKSKNLDELGGRLFKSLPKVDDYQYDKEYYALYFQEVYSKKIRELQEFYGHEFQ